jgi:hypothetical protein
MKRSPRLRASMMPPQVGASSRRTRRDSRRRVGKVVADEVRAEHTNSETTERRVLADNLAFDAIVIDDRVQCDV